MTEEERVRRRGTTPFAEALDKAIVARGVTLSYLHRRLYDLATPVSLATLSYWRSGRSEPERQASIDAVQTLEEVLRLEAGSLVGQLGPPRRSSPTQPEVSVAELSGRDEAVRAALSKLGFTDHDDELADHAVLLVLDVDAQGADRRLRAFSTWRGRYDGARRTASIMTLDHPDEPAPVVRPAGGFRVGEQVSDKENLLHVAELILERPLDEGELALGEEDIELAGIPMEDSSICFYASRRMHRVEVWARFDPACLPARCEAVDVVDGVEETTPMDLDGGRSLYRAAVGFGPGTLGIRWYW